MIRRIIEHLNGHQLKNQKILLPNELYCEACSHARMKISVSTDISDISKIYRWIFLHEYRYIIN